MNKLFSIERPANDIDLIEIFGPVNYGSFKTVFPVTIDGRLHTFRMDGNALWVCGSRSKTMGTEVISLVGELIESAAADK